MELVGARKRVMADGAAEGVRSSPRAGGGAVGSSKAGAAFTFVPDDDDDDDDDDWDRVTGS